MHELVIDLLDPEMKVVESGDGTYQPLRYTEASHFIMNINPTATYTVRVTVDGHEVGTAILPLWHMNYSPAKDDYYPVTG